MLSAVAEIERRVLEVVAGKFTVRENRLTPGTHIRQDLGADSLAVIELVMLLESEFGVDIPDEDVEQIATIQQVVEYLRDEAHALHS